MMGRTVTRVTSFGCYSDTFMRFHVNADVVPCYSQSFFSRQTEGAALCLGSAVQCAANCCLTVEKLLWNKAARPVRAHAD